MKVSRCQFNCKMIISVTIVSKFNCRVNINETKLFLLTFLSFCLWFYLFYWGCCGSCIIVISLWGFKVIIPNTIIIIFIFKIIIFNASDGSRCCGRKFIFIFLVSSFILAMPKYVLNWKPMKMKMIGLTVNSQKLLIHFQF